MSTDSLGKMLPRILFPYVQQWAERSGMTLVSRLLVDEQFRALLEKYGDEVLTRVAQANQRPSPASGATSGAAYGMANGTANGHANGKPMVMRRRPLAWPIRPAPIRVSASK